MNRERNDGLTVMLAVAAHKLALTVAENASRNMENELRTFNTAVQGWKSLIEKLVQDTDAYKDELERKEERTNKWLEKSAAKDVQVLSLQKSILEHEARCRQQQNLLGELNKGLILLPAYAYLLFKQSLYEAIETCTPRH